MREAFYGVHGPELIKFTRWNTGEYEPQCDNRALDIYHPQPEGLKKPKNPDLERANHEWFNLFDRAEW